MTHQIDYLVSLRFVDLAIRFLVAQEESHKSDCTCTVTAAWLDSLTGHMYLSVCIGGMCKEKGKGEICYGVT